jgi:hypothetical protein
MPRTIAAFVGNWGSRYEHVRCDASFCACRLFHGQEDNIFPVEWSQQFTAELQAVGVDVKLRPGEGHVVRNRAAWREAREFFWQKLQPARALVASHPNPSMMAAPVIPRNMDLRNLVY